MGFESRTVKIEAVLFKFRELQEYFAKTGERAYVKAYDDDDVCIQTAAPEYKGHSYFQYRVSMFDYYVENLGLENQILAYSEEEGVVERLNNSNLVWEYAMCASELREVMSL